MNSTVETLLGKVGGGGVGGWRGEMGGWVSLSDHFS